MSLPITSHSIGSLSHPGGRLGGGGPTRSGLRVAASMRHRSSVQSPLGVPSPRFSPKVNARIRQANEDLELQRFWHEVAKPKLTPAQVAYAHRIIAGELGPKAPVQKEEDAKAELRVAKELLQVLLPSLQALEHDIFA